MYGNFNVSKGSKISIKIGETETIGKVVELTYGSSVYENPNTFLLKILSDRGFHYIIPVPMIDSCKLIENPKEPYYIKWFSKWFSILSPNIK